MNNFSSRSYVKCRNFISHICEIFSSKKPDSVVRTVTNVREILDALKNSLRSYLTTYLNDDSKYYAVLIILIFYVKLLI